MRSNDATVLVHYCTHPFSSYLTHILFLNKILPPLINLNNKNTPAYQNFNGRQEYLYSAMPLFPFHYIYYTHLVLSNLDCMESSIVNLPHQPVFPFYWNTKPLCRIFYIFRRIAILFVIVIRPFKYSSIFVNLRPNTEFCQIVLRFITDKMRRPCNFSFVNTL